MPWEDISMASNKQIFISHCVSSAKEKALKLNELLGKESLSTFVCEEIEVGTEFREEIIRSCTACQVMVILMDKEWSDSQECKFEFNTAVQCNKKFCVIPVVIGGLDWIEPKTAPYPCFIRANYQCLDFSPNNNSDMMAAWQKTCEKIVTECKKIVKGTQRNSSDSTPSTPLVPEPLQKHTRSHSKIELPTFTEQSPTTSSDVFDGSPSSTQNSTSSPITSDRDRSFSCSFLDQLYDGKVMNSGSETAEINHFVASCNIPEREKYIETLRTEAASVIDAQSMEVNERVKKLYAIAIALCDVEDYDYAELYTFQALVFLENNPKEEYYVIKILQIFIRFQALLKEKHDPYFNDKMERLVNNCNIVLKKGRQYLNRDKILKTMFLKLYIISQILEKSNSLLVLQTVEVTMLDADEMCRQDDNKGLRARLIMLNTQFYKDHQSDRDAIKELLRARELCYEAYGECSSLMARIYSALGLLFERFDQTVDNTTQEAYECFRRVWLIYRILHGKNHHSTIEAAVKILEKQEYLDYAYLKQDSLPIETHLGSDVKAFGEDVLDDQTRLLIFNAYR